MLDILFMYGNILNVRCQTFINSNKLVEKLLQIGIIQEYQRVYFEDLLWTLSNS